VDLVAKGGALAHERGPVGHPPAKRPGLCVRHPDLGHEVGGSELCEDLRVDLVGPHLRLGDRLGLHRVGHRDLAGVLGEQVDDRPRDRRRLEHHVVGGLERGGEGAQVPRLESPDPANLTPLVHGHFAEVLVDVECERPHGFPPPHRWTIKWGGPGNTTPADSRS